MICERIMIFVVTFQLCKNIVLAGIGNLTLMDDSPVTIEALSSNFFILAEDSNHKGKSIAEFCRESLRDFNPMVHVSIEKGQHTYTDSWKGFYLLS